MTEDMRAMVDALQKRVEYLEHMDKIHTRSILWCEKMCRNNASNWIRLKIRIDTDLAIELSKCQTRHHEKVEQQTQAPLDPTGNKPRIAGDPKPPMLHTFFRLVLEKYDAWQEWYKKASEDERKQVKGMGAEQYAQEQWARTGNTLNPPPETAEALFGGYAAQFMWRTLRDKEHGLITLVPF